MPLLETLRTVDALGGSRLQTEIYIATVLLERNRWTKEKTPTLRVSEWAHRFAEAGFDGIELWENHVTRAPPDELEALRAAPVPVRIFNTYATFGPEDDSRRSQAAEFSRKLGVRGVKFNVGGDPELFDTYVQQVLEWRTLLPQDITPLCECHPGTVLEEPEGAARAFAVWAEAGIGAMFHPFNLTPEQVRTWIRRLGPALSHAHVQLHRDGRMRSLVPYRDHVREILQAMREEGFRGTFSIEFTEGVGRGAEEDIEELFASACADMELLRELF